MPLYILGTTATACSLASIYILLCIYTLHQFFKIVYYRHSLNSFHVLFLWTVFSWSGLRVVYWMSTDSQNTCFSEVVHELPYALQFATFSLVLFFIVNVMYGHRWQTSIRLFEPKLQEAAARITHGQLSYGTTSYSDGSFARDLGQQEEPDSIDPRETHPRFSDETDTSPRGQYLCCPLPCVKGMCFDWKMKVRTFHVVLCIGVNVVITVVVAALTFARCMEILPVSYVDFDRYLTFAIFSLLLASLTVYGYKFSHHGQEPHARNAEMRAKIARLVTFIALICISRCAYALLAPCLPQGFPEIEVMDDGAKHPQWFLVCAEILWEILPAAAVFVFFRGVPKTSHPRSLWRYLQQFWDRTKAPDPSSPALGPTQEIGGRFRDSGGPTGAAMSLGSSAVGGFAPYLHSISSYSHYVQGSLTASAHNYRTIFDDPHRYESDPPDGRHGNILHAPTGSVTAGLYGGVGSNIPLPTFDLLEAGPLVYTGAFSGGTAGGGPSGGLPPPPLAPPLKPARAPRGPQDMEGEVYPEGE
eukprot:TRINITY_DN15695_c0_g1_i1.p1 TRINITY_DN15695_c0_g1~~TRINITY_DN15695_c0_g1_i1.p1  ORF type:complete len:541 (-),score=154.94 TRINITY_DN15695_c0_g1_i1:165-1751(-)